jgi:clan AA aspartic protease
MINGSVNADLEAIIALTLVGKKEKRTRIQAIIDTGFTGHLTLPYQILSSLGANRVGRTHGILADGSVDLFDVYSVTVIWDGRRITIEVEDVDAEPLVGMRMLKNHLVELAVIKDGRVTVTGILKSN